VPDLFRVFPFLSSADPHDPGGALYIPSQGGGRVDNPTIYSVLYLSDSAAGAVAEAFGRFPEWPPAILQGSPSLPGSVRAIARYRLTEGSKICDLDDPSQLQELALRPSHVVSRDYEHTRAWALRIYKQRRWAGVRWWSYYSSAWFSFALWNLSGLTLARVQTLTLEDPAVVEASRAIIRRIVVAR
jgi:hypothetical protein